MAVKPPTHPLLDNWTFWCLKAYGSGALEPEQVASFRTIEEFWRVFLQLPKIGNIREAKLALFRSGIKPLQSERANDKGSALVFTAPNESSKIEELLAHIISGEITKENSLFNGVVFGKVGEATIGELWFGPGNIDKQGISRIINIPASLDLIPLASLANV